ncbi:MAG: glycerol dehydrogenase, partial [Gammaproteobacteria bacterium]
KNAQTVDAYIAIGGGKVVDAGKCIAHRLKVPVIVVPSLASNDAPCSALSVIYSPEGVVAAVEFFPENPALVLVDTGVVAAAEARHLVAGIGDAMATWYEARVCAENKRATNALGGRPTLAGTAIAELCAKTIFEDGLAAVEAVQASIVTDELERVVEANILLSGVGFESGGLALAHGLASGYTVVSHVHKHFLHGEMVAMGLLTQLVIEDRIDEAREVGQFFIKVGLPVHLGQLGLEATNMEELNAIVRNTLTSAIVANMPFEVTETALLSALLAADKLGLEITAADGDEAYRQLQA